MRRIGWLLFGITCALSALQVALLTAADGSMWSYEVIVEQGFPLVTLGSIAGAAVGAVIVARYPRNLIGWLFCLGQLGNALGIAAGAYLFAVDGGGDGLLPATVARYPAQIFNATYTMAFLALIFLLAPDGQLPSHRWWPAPWVPVSAVVLQAAVVIGIPSSDFEPGAAPEYGWHTILLIVAADIALAVSIGLGAAALWGRLRAASGDRRQQLRWLSASSAALTITFIVVIPAQILLAPAPWWVIIAWHLAYVFVSVAVGVAIMRYHLYDIDLILSRTIVLGVLAVFVTVGYVAVVVAIGALLTAMDEGSEALYWPSLVATGLVAVAFQPLRRHVLKVADQLVYGSRAAPYEALAALSHRLADSPTPDALPGRVAEAAGRSVGAARALARLGPSTGPHQLRSATWSALDIGSAQSDSPELVLPVLDMGDEVGSIEITMPAGRALRPFERHLLDDVAAQAGVAFRNALLEAELASRVAQGERQSATLAASRRRLLGAEDDAIARLAGAIQRAVIPHLAAVQDGLNSATTPPRMAPIEVEPLIAETESALEQLRAVCRGLFPALLQRRGLVPALSAQLAATHPYAVLQSDDRVQKRLDRAAEAAAYLFCIEVAPADRSSVVNLQINVDILEATVTVGKHRSPGGTDDFGNSEFSNSEFSSSEFGADLEPQQSQWQNAHDRVTALDGEIDLHGDSDHLQVIARIPIDAPPGRAGDRGG
jgi:signal transduction histidine kinase